MELVFTKHAIERMEKRLVHFSEIIKCLSNPDKIEEIDDVVRYFKLNGSLLIVVCSFYEGYCTIVTVIKTSQINRYLN